MEVLTREVGKELAQDRDCFVYFNNDYGGYAVRNAMELEDLLGGREAGRNA